MRYLGRVTAAMDMTMISCSKSEDFPETVQQQNQYWIFPKGETAEVHKLSNGNKNGGFVLVYQDFFTFYSINPLILAKQDKTMFSCYQEKRQEVDPNRKWP